MFRKPKETDAVQTIPDQRQLPNQYVTPASLVDQDYGQFKAIILSRVAGYTGSMARLSSVVGKFDQRLTDITDSHKSIAKDIADVQASLTKLARESRQDHIKNSVTALEHHVSKIQGLLSGDDNQFNKLRAEMNSRFLGVWKTIKKYEGVTKAISLSDTRDKKIASLLEHSDSGLRFSQIRDRLGLTATPLTRSLKRLVKGGVITHDGTLYNAYPPEDGD